MITELAELASRKIGQAKSRAESNVHIWAAAVVLADEAWNMAGKKSQVPPQLRVNVSAILNDLARSDYIKTLRTDDIAVAACQEILTIAKRTIEAEAVAASRSAAEHRARAAGLTAERDSTLKYARVDSDELPVLMFGSLAFIVVVAIGYGLYRGVRFLGNQGGRDELGTCSIVGFSIFILIGLVAFFVIASSFFGDLFGSWGNRQKALRQWRGVVPRLAAEANEHERLARMAQAALAHLDSRKGQLLQSLQVRTRRV